MKKKAVKQPSTKKGGKKKDKYAELVAPNLQYIQTLAAADVPESTIAEKIGISRQTFAIYKKNYPALERAISKAHEDICENIRTAMYKRAIGYTEVTFRTYFDKNGDEKTEKTEHYYPPEVKAAELLLRQYDKNFRDRGESADAGGEGVLITFEGDAEESAI